jgi:hypothetical protein
MFLIINSGFTQCTKCIENSKSPPSSLQAAEHLGKTQPPLPPLLMRKLSFDTGGEDSATAMKPAAAPDTMPGEIFQLENIVEEPVGIQQKQRCASCRSESYPAANIFLPLSSSPFLHT